MKDAIRIMVVLVMVAVGACDGGDETIGGSGFIEATSVVVSAEAGGRLEALFTDEGETIAADAPLGIIDSTMVKLKIGRALAERQAAVTALEVARIAIEQADQNATLAQKEYERIASLLKKGSANQQQFDEVQNRHEQSRLAQRQTRATLAAREAEIDRIDAEIALLERERQDCYPLAPVDGTVIDKLVETGELLAPGRPIVEIARIDTVWVKVYLPAKHLTAVQIGQPASVDPEDGRTEPLEGRVVWISDEAEFTPKNVQTADARADLVYAVKVNVANPEGILKIGMPVMARFDR